MQVCNSLWIIAKMKTCEMSVWAKFAKISFRKNFYLYSISSKHSHTMYMYSAWLKKEGGNSQEASQFLHVHNVSVCTKGKFTLPNLLQKDNIFPGIGTSQSPHFSLSGILYNSPDHTKFYSLGITGSLTTNQTAFA